MVKKLPCTSALLLLFAAGPAAAQAPANLPAAQVRAPATPLTLRQCYRKLGADSVVFYYDARYTLVPPGCAALRRHSRIDSAGAFHGVVEDYQLTNNALLLRGGYRHGQKEGMFELFYGDGAPAVRAYYHAGQPVGDWTYWYHSGQPRQVVRFDDPARPTLQRFWSAEGQLLVVGGEGQWQWEEGGTRQVGAIHAGRPEGRWMRRFVRGGQPYAVEYFAKGEFRKGQIFYQPAAGQYVIPLDAEQPPFLDQEDFDRAETLALGQPCLPVPPLR